MLNDASALLIYRLAVGAALAGPGNHLHIASTLVLVLLGSAAVGIISAFAFGNLVGRFSDVPSSIIIQFIGAFAVWILADRLHLSGVLAIVTFAVILSRRPPIQMPASVRVPSYAVWETAVFLLNALAFVMVGLQIDPIFARVDYGQRLHMLKFAVAATGTVIIARAAWAMTYNRTLWTINRLLGRRLAASRSPEHIPCPMNGGI